MTERPIIFSAPMVRAILAGRKMMTRRLYKPREGSPYEIMGELPDGSPWPHWFDPHRGPEYHPCRLRWAVGDRLWVRETWGVWPATLDEEKQVLYRATVEQCSEGWQPRRGPISDYVRWRPSIFMPRWASRITLDVTSVRVERLQDITPEDCEAEGVCDIGYIVPRQRKREAFATLWNSINKKRADWASNPWVCVVSFKRVEVGQ